GAVHDIADVEARNDIAVAIDILLREVAKQPAAPSYHLEKAAARVVIVLVSVEVRSQVVNTGGQNSNLHFGRPRIGLVYPVLPYNLLLTLGLQSQSKTSCGLPALVAQLSLGGHNPLVSFFAERRLLLFLLHLFWQYPVIISQPSGMGKRESASRCPF